jgi:hypothetical protein
MYGRLTGIKKKAPSPPTEKNHGQKHGAACTTRMQPARAQRIASDPVQRSALHRIPCSAAHRANATSPRALRALATTLIMKVFRGPRIIAVTNSKKARDWAIRSQALKVVIDKAIGKVQRLHSFGF